MASATVPKVEAVTVSICVPKQVNERFIEAARMIGEITPHKPVVPEDLVTFTLLKETTATIVIEYLEWVQNRDHCDRLVRQSKRRPRRTKKRDSR